jgi:sulfur relay (sulfurtransferase) complex TusBCD TusD component (DsrE family)
VSLLVCKPCFEVRGLATQALHARARLAGMNEFHAAAASPDARVINF